MDSIFTRIRDQVQDDALLDLLANQVGKLSGASQELTALIDNPPDSLPELVSVFNALPLPDIDPSSALNTGFETLSTLIPTEAGELTGELSGAIEQFFAGLTLNLTSQLTQFLDAFRALHHLTQIDFSSGESTAEADPNALLGAPVPAGIVVAGEAFTTRAATLRLTNANGMSEALESIRSFLDVLPDPLTVESLLASMSDILQGVPRSLTAQGICRFLMNSTISWKPPSCGGIWTARN